MSIKQVSKLRARGPWVRGVAFLFPLVAFAGQSLVVKSSQTLTFPDPILSQNQSWRIEFQIHNWVLPPANVHTAVLFGMSGAGAIVRLYPNGTLEIENRDPVNEQAPCFLPLNGLTTALVRIQKDSGQMRFSCEAWNFDATGYRSQVETMNGLKAGTFSGGAIGPIGDSAGAALGFLRLSTALVPLGSRPPTTADAGNWTELKFDGNLQDSSGNGHSAGGTGTYMDTPNQVAVAVAKTFGAPAWTNWTSLRAGFPAQLDGSASYSLADASSAVSYSWQQLSGPSTVIWADPAQPAPTLSGLIFGTYQFSLKVRDGAGNTNTAMLETGAVATDDNGVVINADPNVDKFFGPMIAFGKNPWGYADERALKATQLRASAYDAQGLTSPSWTHPGPGTVTYVFNGSGSNGAAPGTTLASPVDANATSIAINDASVLDLSELPTRILLGYQYPREDIRICATTATQGPATLSVCYDGRGQSDSYRRTGPTAWPAGTSVGQMKVTGAGTAFLSDICPAGGGPPGKITYNSGLINLQPGSRAVTGSDTSWDTADGVLAGYQVRVSATAGGVPFTFYAYISTVTDQNDMVLARPYPADADAGTFAYSIIQADTRALTLHYNRPSDGSDAQTYFLTTSCESDSSAYLYIGHDIAQMNGTLQSGKQYSYVDGLGYTGAFGPNFYGEDLAHRALYYRSGWTFALNTARVFGDNFVNSPLVSGGDVGGIPLLLGGGSIGGFAAAVLDTDDPNRPSWGDLRGLAKNGSIGNSTCNAYDTRDSSYLGTWLALAADFDPDPIQRANWKAQMALLYNRDRNCKGADNSWANGFLYNAGSAALNMTRGSAVVTGVNIPQSLCYGIASGTVSVTNGSAVVTGSGFVPGNKIVITGTRGGAPYTGFFRFSLNSNGSLLIAALWPGDSGTATYVIENNDALTTIGISNNDAQLTRNWACTWNNASQITLDRPWDGPTESNAHAYSYVLAGFGQQPYMLGIKITQMQYASQSDDPALGANYTALAALAADWLHDVGFDAATQGLNYGRIMQACEPVTVPPPGSTFDVRTPGCNFGLNPASIRTGRVLTAEASQALRIYYQAHPTPEAKAWGDMAYGSIWGYAPYTTGGVYTDTNYVRDENSDASLGSYKWTGFFFGMGMAHQWPAVRLGGVAQPRFRMAYLDFDHSLAAKSQIVVTAPSGAKSTFACEPKLPCEVRVDDRQGAHWYRIQYLSPMGKLLFQSEPRLLDGPGSGKTQPVFSPAGVPISSLRSPSSE